MNSVTMYFVSYNMNSVKVSDDLVNMVEFFKNISVIF